MDISIKDLKQMKESYGFTLKEISKASDVPMSTVLKVFSGSNKNPRRSTILKLQEGLIELINNDNNKIYSFDSLRDEDFVAETNRTNAARKKSEGNIDIYNARRSMEEQHIIRKKKNGNFTIDDLSEMPEGIRYEICDGRLIKMESPSVLHQLLAAEIHSQIRSFILKNNGKCIPFIAPLDVQLDEEGKNVFEPDVFVFCKELGSMKRVVGTPDLIIEIISESTRKYDMQTKLAKYTEYGVREYWIVDPNKRRVVVNLLEQGDIAIYTFDTPVPVGIYEGKLKINFDKMPEYVKAYYE